MRRVVISCPALARIVNASRGTVVASQAEKAESHWARLMGLMGRRGLPEGGALLITPCSSVQTFFMRFAIDVVFLDGDGQVVKVVPALKPYRAGLGRARSPLRPGAAGRRCRPLRHRCGRPAGLGGRVARKHRTTAGRPAVVRAVVRMPSLLTVPVVYVVPAFAWVVAEVPQDPEVLVAAAARGNMVMPTK